MIVQCRTCRKRFVETDSAKSVSDRCPTCRNLPDPADAANPAQDRWVSPAPIHALKSATAPQATPTPAVAISTPSAVPVPAPAPVPAAPIARRPPNLGPRPQPRRWPGVVVAATLALGLHALVLAGLGAPARPATASAPRTIELAALSPTILAPRPAETLESFATPGPDSRGGDDASLERTLTLLPTGHRQDNTIRTQTREDGLAALVPMPIAGSTREPFDLSTLTLQSGGPVRARFMGLEASGRRFCIIADRSGSMNWGGKIEHLKAEILKTVGELRGGARFYVILFSDAAETIPARRWLGGREDVARTEAWLRSVNADGGTFPLPAFELAFKMNPRPDAIFFMTDGLFPMEVAPAVKALNGSKHRVPIHAISFLDQSAEALLRQIAAQSGGTYRHVAGF